MLRKVWSSSYRSSVSFQILSDLHLEVNQQYSSYEIPACAEYLILAGDIGRLTDYDDYRNFLQKQTDRFRSVFLLLGNHEFYNETFDTGIEMAKQLEQDPAFDGRLIVLHQKRYDVPDWSVDDHNARHDSDYSWLTKEIHSIHEENRTVAKDSKRRSILVVTHHAPSLQGTSNPRHAQSPWSVAFGTNILSEVPDGVKVWVFGHTHYNTDFKEKGVRVVSNQRGYVLPGSDPKADSGFDVRKQLGVCNCCVVAYPRLWGRIQPRAESRGWEQQPPVSKVHHAESPIVIIPSSTPHLDHISGRARAPVRFSHVLDCHGDGQQFQPDYQLMVFYRKHTTTMTSRGSNPVSRLAEAAKEKVAPSTSSKAKDPTENWTPEEMFETTLDKNGNPVPDAISYIDGPKMTQKRQGPDEGDVFDAANQDFD
ncbi:hypothetical protein M752DRAFT_322083 [Aspergillus phoenicis ATCC 13157]|uniref:Calcineurin-like phosphoesterase domain-containing protein n=1 Tax=Aspergillus phoenicis ATCC 13157 TaxID=1353007 RepID=A0A370P4R6_ASPPH|nr:hypothetical protein M752DRAFT_322083 [Aspergillus phoenicis ATCC 13157]